MPESIPYLSVGFDVGADFTWMFIILPNDILIGKPLKIIHSDPQSRELAISKIKEVREMYSLGNRCPLEPIGIYHVPLLCFLRDKSFDRAVINPIITKDSTNMNVRKLYNGKFDSEKAAKVGLDALLKASTVLDGAIINLHNLMHDYCYLKDLQSAIVLKFHAELKVSFPTYLSMFSKVIVQIFLKLLEAYPFAAGILAAPEDELVETIRNTARFGKTYALARYDAICAVVKDAAVFGHALPSSALRIRPYIKIYREHQAHLGSILEELHQAVGKLEGTPNYDHISFIQTLHGVGSLNTIVLIAEAGAFGLFSSPRELHAYFRLDPGVNDSSKFHGNRVHVSKRGSNLVRCILHIVAINNLKMDKVAKTPVDPVIYDYYIRKCASKKKSIAIGAAVHKICGIIFVMLRGNKPSEFTTPEEHRERYAAEHPESVNPAA